MTSLLVELFVEELPPKVLNKLGASFASVLAEQLIRRGLSDANAVVTHFATPRRLAAHISHVVDKAPDKSVLQKLMPASVGLDASGAATQALLKKLQSLGADASAVSQLKRVPDGKTDFLHYDSMVKGISLTDGLQAALQESIAQLPIPKVMSYQLESGCDLPGWSSVSFVRPAHGLLALHGNAVVPVHILGLHATNTTRGHRFEASADPLIIEHADNYAKQLARHGAVIASFGERRELIAQQLKAACENLGNGMQAIQDDALLDEVTALVERPHVLVCEFEQQFLDVPQECLILTMKANQKYFPLLDKNGKLSNKFLVVSNINPENPRSIIEGNERVVRPRLADAKFFFEQDRKKSLESRVPNLDRVVYHNKLGTQGERSARVGDIAKVIAKRLGGQTLANASTTAARLAKADLLTEMVGEFPELQGIMGGYYALHDGLGEEVAQAIEDHYKPRFAGDNLPRNQVGVVVALADKIETLVGMFGIGNLPTGDKDPFALRRHALGVIRMLMELDLPLNLNDLLADAVPAFGELVDDPVPALTTFIQERLSGALRDQGFSSHEVDAVLALNPSRLGDIPKRLEAVRAFAALPQADALAAANKRIANILKKAGDVDPHVSQVLLQEPAELALFGAMKTIAPEADLQFDRGDYTDSLQTLAQLRGPVDDFFNDVMVNVPEMDLRLNRQGLLKYLHGAMNRVADLSRLAR